MQSNNYEHQQVTAVISQLVRPGREQGYEEWLKGISAAAKKFPGHGGVSIIRPKHNDPSEWIERSRPLVENPQDVQTLTGLENWFTLPDKPLKPAPPGYKMVVVTWLGVQILTILISYLLTPSLSKLPLLLNLSISNVIVVVGLTYLVMPQLTRLFYKWLYSSRSSS